MMQQISRIVLANSVGIDREGVHIIHSPSRWTEGVTNPHHWFAYYPWELACATTLLKRDTDHQVTLVDGCLEHLGPVAYIERLAALEPDWLVMESATRVYEDNLRVALEVKRRCGSQLIFVGQHAMAFPKDVLAAGVDHVVVGEYEESLAAFFRGVDLTAVPGLYPNSRAPLVDFRRLPWPEDDDVSRLAYATPGEPSQDYLEIQAYASRGCPRSCSFCVVRQSYFGRPNWRPRDPEDVVEELAYLKTMYPALEGIFFDEEEHNVGKPFILKLSQAIRHRGLDALKIQAMCDIEWFDQEMLEAMQAAGYYKVRFSLESASDIVQEAINKKLDIPKAIEQIKLIKRVGLKTYSTFMFGAPGSNAIEDQKTIDLIRRLGESDLLDNLQVSICTPQPGTPLYAWASEHGYLRTHRWSDYDGGRVAVLNFPEYSSSAIQEMKRLAFDVRDHTFLVRHWRQRTASAWVRKVFRQYGWWGSMRKLLARAHREARYRIKQLRRRSVKV